MKGKKLKTAIFFTENILKKAEEDDVLFKAQCLKENKSEKAGGKSFMVYHLTHLLQLLKELED